MPVPYEAHYENLAREGELPSRCRMALTGVDLAGKRVLDVGCRRGKGAYKLSERAGAEGRVIGVDWDAAYLEEARAGVASALARSGLTTDNMEFRQAFPEDLSAADLADASVDVVYVNNGCMLFADPAEAVRECARVLAPGGLLVLEAVAAECESAPTDLTAAYATGDSTRAARPRAEVGRWLADAGFTEASIAEELPADSSAPNSPTLLVLHARKR